MICRILHLQSEQEWVKASQWLDGRFNPGDSVEGSVREILANVREKGDEALIDYTRRFDCPEFAAPLRVSEQDIAWAAASISPEHREQISEAAHNIRTFHKEQLEKSWFQTRPDGSILGQRVLPVDRVGLYVPGGQGGNTPLLSSMLMNAIPASVAGVERIACVTPPSKDGSLDSAILAACKIAGVTEIYSVGGAQAVGALAYGTETIEPVAKITGPGNAYVAAAKKIVSGDVGIDMIAGPSEVCVVADETADPALVAIDLMAQAEHDPLAACYLVTFSEEYADKIEAAIERHVKHSTRAEITMASLNDHGLITICPDRKAAIQAVNVIAPEHLELHVENAMDLLGSIKNAGAIFLGEWTPEAVGDYVAGPNHTLPTGGTARYASPLSVEEFVKKSSIIQYTPEALAADADSVMTIARHEGLWAHAMSVELRCNELAGKPTEVDAGESIE